ncbi:hypothetical protein COX95_01565 [bacterium CG_4_10_14_0_2_um_filter_33_32]|nr:MAG: hypothetical protein AUJ93_03895 [bacterium CG2_30_33_46]PIU76524.1 MAG: hypothetical protein COS74_03555 [bacterium CG06_land_8_20_14_3_00_33_50]PIW81208.1 MAG: hypothetical protein COZ97_02950 [bacterium CG_4_8_14_3_um_filter_33_28]PIY85576.1 MAG: hypothetical protein COY76_01410 [bacterium CG_4_10_14_0_8_um_filter_33_57]PIZ86361.1 MAG: hypothetical protein COX95_01565 [bacterium CG_4_10_14_0_2_um_filter_33_32]PJA72610.1 MAG: hypothetical protein CO152_00500 [bacterium CG_4_9_14_3_um
MNNHQLEELIKNIQSMIKCPSCGSSYKKENVQLMGQLGQAVLVQLSCYICKMPVMATIVVSGPNAGKPSFEKDSIEKILDNNPIEPIKEKTENPVSSNEILEMHEFLDGFDGNFESLFNK